MSEVKKFNPEEHFVDLKGKKYLQVMWRLVWFREDHPDWHINTELVEHLNGECAVFKASIVEPNTEMTISTGYGSEHIKDFKDYLEKAETKAVGRALAMLGYGTQFAPELDEGERIVDSPVAVKEAKQEKLCCTECGKQIEDFTDRQGKKVSAKRIAESSQKKFGKVLCVECGAKAQSTIL